MTSCGKVMGPSHGSGVHRGNPPPEDFFIAPHCLICGIGRWRDPPGQLFRFKVGRQTSPMLRYGLEGPRVGRGLVCHHQTDRSPRDKCGSQPTAPAPKVGWLPPYPKPFQAVNLNPQPLGGSKPRKGLDCRAPKAGWPSTVHGITSFAASGLRRSSVRWRRHAGMHPSAKLNPHVTVLPGLSAGGSARNPTAGEGHPGQWSWRGSGGVRPLPLFADQVFPISS